MDDEEKSLSHGLSEIVLSSKHTETSETPSMSQSGDQEPADEKVEKPDSPTAGAKCLKEKEERREEKEDSPGEEVEEEEEEESDEGVDEDEGDEEDEEEEEEEEEDFLKEEDMIEDDTAEADRHTPTGVNMSQYSPGRSISSAPIPPLAVAEKSPVTGSSSSPSNTEASSEDASIYHVKWVQFSSKQLPILTQNANGPCPLIAIANVLLLRQAIQLPSNAELVTSQQIVEFFGDYLLSADVKSLSSEQMANFQQNMNDAFVLFPKLQTGLDMNLRFSGVRDFEYTPELAIFDLFEIPIFHGWVVDPQEVELAEIVRNCSYNQLVEKIIIEKADESQEKVRQALLAEQFLELTASQLTYHGLCELNAAIKDEQLGVLFRNNHFNTLFKYKDALYLLVTDQGLLHETRVVWETLNDIDGDSRFLDSSFRPYQKPEPSAELPAVPSDFVNTPAQVDSDYQLALSLFNEGNNPANRQDGIPPSTESDYALARRLQEEEDSLMAAEGSRERQAPSGARVPRSASQPTHPPAAVNPAPQRQRTVSQSRGRNNGESCSVL